MGSTEFKPRVFVDTSALLRGFAIWRAGGRVPLFLHDARVERCTFEKCLFEFYMAFRGIGGKKPDEGRGDWAQRHLRGDLDPKTIERLTTTVHGGSRNLALFWLSNIEGIPSLRELVHAVRGEDREKFLDDEDKLDELRVERNRYKRLCDSVTTFLLLHGVNVLPYSSIFGTFPHHMVRQNDDLCPYNADALDRFVRETAIPSEDLEIVFAAERANSNVFVTDDKRLSKCVWSLGLNRSLSAASFCCSDDPSYDSKVHQFLTGDLFADWE